MDLRQLVRAFDAGRIDADTLVWRKGMPDWRRLRDVSELSERLLGGDVNKEGAPREPLHAGEPEQGVSRSEPPPRQSERSRTPPASYTVGARTGSEPAAAEAPPAVATEAARPERPSATFSAAPGSVAAGVESGRAESVPRPARTSAPPASSRPHSRRPRGKTPSRPNASLAPSRTVTQTGLETPAEVSARNSRIPPAPSASGGASAEASETARPSSVSGNPPASRSRDSRAAAAQGGGRRAPSNDETPAQKPSSVSVHPGTLLASPSKPRGRRLVALAAIVLSAAVLVKAFTTGGDQPTADAKQAGHDTRVPESIEKALAPEPGKPASNGSRSAAAGRSEGSVEREPSGNAAGDGFARVGSGAENPTTSAARAQNDLPTQNDRAASVATAAPAMEPRSVPGGNIVSAKQVVGAPAKVPPAPSAPRPVASAPAAAAPKAPARPAAVTPAGSPVSPTAAPAVAAAPPAAAPAAEAAAVSAPPAAAPPAETAANSPAPPVSSPPGAAAPAGDSAANPPAAAPPANPPASPASPPAAAVPPANPPAGAAPPAASAPAVGAAVPAPAAPAPPSRPFDLKAASSQLETAAVKAASCGNAGSTRGSGRVSVAIEPWGRVRRVTHLNQDFVGTPVGLCIMQAFQQIQVPPFDGEARSIAGAFAIE
jgi:hypothetical protein